MSLGEWLVTSGSLQGDASYSLRKVLVTPVYIDFELTLFSERWKEVDIEFEYRNSSRDIWKADATILETTSNYLRGNKFYGLTASKEGSVHSIRWQYSSDSLIYGNNIQIQIGFLPRVRVLGSASGYHSISSYYGDSLNNFEGISRHDCIGIDNSGNYMCLAKSSFYIIDSLDATEESTSSDSSSTYSSTSSTSTSKSSTGDAPCIKIADIPTTYDYLFPYSSLNGHYIYNGAYKWMQSNGSGNYIMAVGGVWYLYHFDNVAILTGQHHMFGIYFDLMVFGNGIECDETSSSSSSSSYPAPTTTTTTTGSPTTTTTTTPYACIQIIGLLAPYDVFNGTYSWNGATYPQDGIGATGYITYSLGEWKLQDGSYVLPNYYTSATQMGTYTNIMSPPYDSCTASTC